MGFTFRKSIKVGKNTRINLSSKGGIGISTGVKGARISTNKQGTRIYGGKGCIRYQKKISGSNHNYVSNMSNINNGQQGYEYSNEVKKSSKFTVFMKKYYKEIIIILIGLIIGSSIGSIGRVDNTKVTEIKNEIRSNTVQLDNKNEELDNLNDSKKALEEIVNK